MELPKLSLSSSTAAPLHPKSENSSDIKSKSEMDYSQKASWSNALTKLEYTIIENQLKNLDSFRINGKNLFFID